MKKLLLFLIAILLSFTSFSQDLSQQANDCFNAGDYACAEEKYEAYYKLAKPSQKQIIEIKIQTVKWCLNKLEEANKLFESESYKDAKNIYNEILSANPKDNFSKNQIIQCDLLVEKTLSISSSNIIFTKDADTKKIDVLTNSSYYSIVTKDNLPDWLTVTVHLDYVTVSCEPNNKRKSRSSYFYIKAGPNRSIVYVTQEGKKKMNM
jgi:tetratricopeptide (TPR) repeat protein